MLLCTPSYLVMVTDNQLKAFVLCVEHQALNAYVWYTCLLILFKRKKKSSDMKGFYQLNAIKR